MDIQKKLEHSLGKPVSQAENRELYSALLSLVQEMAADRERLDGKKKVYYISAEFLIGKLLSNNLINLGIYGEVKKILRITERICARLKSLSRNPLWETAGWGVWPPAFWIPSLRWGWPETESD